MGAGQEGFEAKQGVGGADSTFVGLHDVTVMCFADQQQIWPP